MATIRWCPIFPKWDSYQPLFPTFVENKEQPRALQMYRTWTIGADTVLQIPCTNFVHCDVFCTCWYAHATLNKTYKTTSMVSNERFRIWSQDRLGNTFWWEVLPAVVRAWFPRAFSVWNQRVTICQNEPRKSRRKLSEVSHFRVTVPSRVCLQGKVQWMPFRLKIGDTSRIPQDTSGYLQEMAISKCKILRTRWMFLECCHAIHIMPDCVVSVHEKAMLETVPHLGDKFWIWLPSGYVNIAIENGHWNVDFPIKNGDFP